MEWGSNNNNGMGYNTPSGSYAPSAYEKVMADIRTGQTQSLMDYAAQNNARAQAASRISAGALLSGDRSTYNEQLFNSKRGAGIRLGSQYFENVYGSGSYVDLMAGSINSAQFGGLRVGSFGRASAATYGSGPAADFLAKSMFDRSNKFFSNANGTDNLARTQGLGMTEISKIQQTLISSGRYANDTFGEFRSTSLGERIRFSANDLEKTGNTSGASRLRSTLANYGGNESMLQQTLKSMLSDSTLGGDLKGSIKTALDSTSSFIENPQALDKLNEDAVKMAKVITKLKNVYGNVAKTDIFKISGASIQDVDGLARQSRDADKFITSARVAGYGENVGQFALLNDQTHQALSQIYGSSTAAGSQSRDVTSNIVLQARLNKASGGNLTESQVANSVLSDIAGTQDEGNIKELIRLAAAAELSKDPAQIAKVASASKLITSSLDPTAQAAALSNLRGELGNPTVLLSEAEQRTLLQETKSGERVFSDTTSYAGSTVMRTYKNNALALGVDSNTYSEYEKILKTIGSANMANFLNGDEALINDTNAISALKESGVDTGNIKDFIKNNKKSLLNLTDQTVKDTTHDNTVKGSMREQIEKDKARMEDIKQATIGSEAADPTANQTMIRVGIDMLLNGSQGVRSNDVTEYELLTKGIGNGGVSDFMLDNEKKNFKFKDSAARAAFVAKNGGADKTALEQALNQEDNFSAVFDIVKNNGGTFGIKGNDGIVLSEKEMEQKSKELQDRSRDSALKGLGLNINSVMLDSKDNKYGEQTALAAKAKLAQFGSTWATLKGSVSNFGMITEDGIVEAGAERGLRGLAGGDGYTGTDADKLRKRNDAAGILLSLKNGGLDAAAKADIFSEIGADIMTDDAYRSTRDLLGLDGISEKTRKKLSEDGGIGQLVDIMLNKQAGGVATPEQQAYIDQLKAGGGGKTTSHMTVQHMTVLATEYKRS